MFFERGFNGLDAGAEGAEGGGGGGQGGPGKVKEFGRHVGLAAAGVFAVLAGLLVLYGAWGAAVVCAWAAVRVTREP